MIWNIIDRRTNKYKWKKVDAIVEPTWHDNKLNPKLTKAGHDKVPKKVIKLFETKAGIGYEEQQNLGIDQAINWATTMKYPVTLYLYDPNTIHRAVKVGKSKLKCLA